MRYSDVNGDGVLSPIDALLVINELNNPTASEGEAEAPPVVDTQANADKEMLRALAFDIEELNQHRR